MPRRPCLDCGVPTPGTRCPTHTRQHDQQRNATRTHYRGDWPALARAVVAQHRATHGDWCPGWAVPPHPATDLTCDHVDPRSLTSGLRVLCRACNGRRGTRPD
jgi:5-methylcytosine-specific restriction protein A